MKKLQMVSRIISALLFAMFGLWLTYKMILFMVANRC